MALTQFQRDVCRLLARQRIASGESYVAGGVALNELTSGSRISRDIDLFHDTREALARSWSSDRVALSDGGYAIDVLNERPGFVQAIVAKGSESVLVEWTHDSAYRFFPLLEHSELGAVLHPFDLATNKLLALVGRVEARDWVDVIHCDSAVQPLGYIAWAACAKDPGFSPASILEHASRTAHYSTDELQSLAYEAGPPPFAALSAQWREIIGLASEVIAALPAEQVGTCVMSSDGLFRGDVAMLREFTASGRLWFHMGAIRGAFPRIVTE